MAVPSSVKTTHKQSSENSLNTEGFPPPLFIINKICASLQDIEYVSLLFMETVRLFNSAEKQEEWVTDGARSLGKEALC